MKTAIVLLCLVLYVIAENDGADTLNEKIKENQLFGIKGGRTIDIKKRPYNVAVIHKNYGHFFGGGVLINNKWVLTAAYNVNWTENIEVRLGSENATYGGSLISIQKIIVHPKYSGKYQYDVALLKLVSTAKISPKIKPITLGTSLPKAGANTVLTGFGGTAYKMESNALLKEAQVPFIPYNTCKKNYMETDLINELNFCASKLGVGGCPMDWGSPLVYKNKVIGIFCGSYNDCDSQAYPGVFVDLTKLSDWIKKSIKS